MVITMVGAAGTDARSRVVIRVGLQYKPREMPISGDGDVTVRQLRWRTWGGPKAVARGQVIEQERPSHRDLIYPGRVTASRRVYCARLHRTVYNQVSARLLSRGKGAFGVRTFSRISTCSGSWRLAG